MRFFEKLGVFADDGQMVVGKLFFEQLVHLRGLNLITAVLPLDDPARRLKNNTAKNIKNQRFKWNYKLLLKFSPFM